MKTGRAVAGDGDDMGGVKRSYYNPRHSRRKGKHVLGAFTGPNRSLTRGSPVSVGDGPSIERRAKMRLPEMWP